MSKGKLKFLKTLKKMEEYEKVAFSRLETFYFAIVKSYSHFNKINTATDENIKEKFSKTYDISEKTIHFLECVLFEKNVDVVVEKIDCNEIIFKMFHYNNKEFLRVDTIFAYGTEIEFEKYIKDLKQKLLKY